MRLVEKTESTPATHASIAALEFRSVKAFRGMTQHARLTKAHGLVEALRPMSVIALKFLAKSKPEMISMVRADHDFTGNMLMAS